MLDHQCSTVNESYANDTEDIELYEQQNTSMQPPETLHTSGDEELSILKPEQKISFTTEDGNCCGVIVINRAGKKSGKYKHWYNIEYLYP